MEAVYFVDDLLVLGKLPRVIHYMSEFLRFVGEIYLCVCTRVPMCSTVLINVSVGIWVTPVLWQILR